MENKNAKVKDEDKKDRIFFSKAYLVEVEKGTYGLYRNLEKQEWNETLGDYSDREKLKVIGPIGLFRKCENNEQPDLTSFDPKDNKPISLKNLAAHKEK